MEAGKRSWEKFLHAHRLWRAGIAEKRLEVFARTDQFAASVPVTQARSLLAQTLARLRRTLEEQLKAYRQRIEEVFARHPDHDLCGSLPGAVAKLAPRLLAELGSDRGRFPHPEALQCHAGTAPVTIQSGQITKCTMRHACQHHLRAAVHLWSNLSRHACALRCLGQRWLKILWKMWQTKKAYDADLHAINHQKHGSWVLALKPS